MLIPKQILSEFRLRSYQRVLEAMQLVGQIAVEPTSLAGTDRREVIDLVGRLVHVAVARDAEDYYPALYALHREVLRWEPGRPPTVTLSRAARTVHRILADGPWAGGTWHPPAVDA
ncbi:MAG: hypothetical protein ABMB14_17805 [Myxococcota bacterium]